MKEYSCGSFFSGLGEDDGVLLSSFAATKLKSQPELSWFV